MLIKRIQIYLAVLTFCLFATPILGGDKELSVVVERNQTGLTQQNLIVNMYQYLNSIMLNKKNPILVDNLKKYFTEDLTMITNNKKVLTGYAALIKHFEDIRGKLLTQVHFPILEIVTVGNKVVVKYNINLYQKDKVHSMNVIAIMTTRDNKIQKWDEVVYSDFLCSKVQDTTGSDY